MELRKHQVGSESAAARARTKTQALNSKFLPRRIAQIVVLSSAPEKSKAENKRDSCEKCPSQSHGNYARGDGTGRNQMFSVRPKTNRQHAKDVAEATLTETEEANRSLPRRHGHALELQRRVGGEGARRRVVGDSLSVHELHQERLHSHQTMRAYTQKHIVRHSDDEVLRTKGHAHGTEMVRCATSANGSVGERNGESADTGRQKKNTTAARPLGR